jgi:hypothetical protein
VLQVIRATGSPNTSLTVGSSVTVWSRYGRSFPISWQPASRSRRIDERMSCLNSVPNGLEERTKPSSVWYDCASSIGSWLPPSSMFPPRMYGSPLAFANARAPGKSGSHASCTHWVVDRPR